jgi:hypothetical protein
VQLLAAWDGDGDATLGMVRGSTWSLRNGNPPGGIADLTFAYGHGSDLQAAGDWDGDGRRTPGVVRGTTWSPRNSNDPADPTTVPLFTTEGPVTSR